MNNEKLILESLSWIIANTKAWSEVSQNEKLELYGRINDAVNPEEEKPVSEETYDGLNVEGETKWKK